MTIDNETSVINVTQADRDLVYDILSPLAENGVHLFELRGLKEGLADDADAVQLAARHRTTSLAAQDVEREPMREYCNEAIYEPKVAATYPRPSLAAQDGLVEALRIARVYVQNVVDAESKAFNAKDLAQIDAALASIEVKS